MIREQAARVGDRRAIAQNRVSPRAETIASSVDVVGASTEEPTSRHERLR